MIATLLMYASMAFGLTVLLVTLLWCVEIVLGRRMGVFLGYATIVLVASFVAYAVYAGVCLVSPDPIGPEAERDQLWSAFRTYADAHGWTVAVLGAGEDWLPTYRSSGMHDLYLGDEGVVDVTRFSLQGGRNKGLRQAVNRIARYGYTISFHDPARLAPAAGFTGIRRHPCTRLDELMLFSLAPKSSLLPGPAQRASRSEHTTSSSLRSRIRDSS